MAASRIALAIPVVLALAASAAARPPCTLDTISIPTCADVGAAASARFCFGTACTGSGPVFGVRPPDAPFQSVGLHVDGPLGSRPVTAADFPVTLGPGEALVLDVQVVASSVGDTRSSVTWYLGAVVDDQHQGGHQDPQTPTSCSADIVASVPACGGDPGNPCAQTACRAGACVPVPATGPCDDRCHTGGTCLGTACVGGTPIDCDDGNACTRDSCDPAVGCVHRPDNASCDDHDSCTADVCDPARGCIHTPRTGPCDDGDACTTNDRCRNGVCQGDPVHCSDPYACTDDRCVDGHCVFVPVDANCDAGECGRASCRPDDPSADRRGCVQVPVGEGEACTDDGVSCTDDVCTDGSCLHVPVDGRCGSADSCTAMVCAPQRSGADAAGCASAGQPRDGGTCAEDGDPCSTDTCSGGACRHDRVPEWNTCIPVQGAFRRALGLVSLAGSLHTTVATVPPTAKGAAAAGMRGVATSLAGVETDLQAAVDMLAGRAAAATAVGVGETPAMVRARLASEGIARTPAEVRGVITRLRARAARSVLGVDGWRAVRRRAAVLLHGTKSLKAELQRLQQVSRTFAR